MTILWRFGFPKHVCTAALVLSLCTPHVFGDEENPGEQIYLRKCASCHGVHGEGKTDRHATALEGDKSIGELTEYISRTMPEDKPGTCVGDEAARVSQFIHEAFYSPAAQARNKPARIELARLTVGQYRNAIADLVGHFRTAGQSDVRHGMNGKYFKSREFENNDLVFERLDPTVAFNFQDHSPHGEKIPPHEFAIRWEGSLTAPDTGLYEFHVASDHSFRLWINDLKRPMIDAYVKSKTDNEDRASIFLIAGRSYPLRLDFSKAKQGVQDGKASESPPAPASISLEWTQPHRVKEVIPERFLSPRQSAELCVVNTSFPSDDRSSGWERATSISKEWDQATTDAAIEVASYVEGHLQELTLVNDDDPNRVARLKDFCFRFAELAFRRPLDEELRRTYVDQQFDQEPDPVRAVNRVVLFVLKSPRFLYREVDATSSVRNDSYDVASRISFGLWDSIPDRLLLEAASTGRLVDRDQVVAQANRMLSDPRSESKLREFFLRWMKIDRVPDIRKDQDLFPDFTPQIAHDLRTSIELHLEEFLVSESANYRDLLLSDSLYLNGRLAKFYGVDLPPDAPFQKVSLDPAARAGLLTHPYLLSDFSYSATSSPIHRGLFVARSVLGRTMRPPPEAVTPLTSQSQPNLTTRERIALQTGHESCQSCHSLINPLGFTLEQFDAVGRFRTEEKGKLILTTGSYRTRSGDTVQFDGARNLATYLAESSEAHGAFVQQLFHFAIKQPIHAYGPQTRERLRHVFEEEKLNIRRVLIEIIATSALTVSDAEPNPIPTSTPVN